MLKSNPGALRRIRELKGHTGPSLARVSGVSQPRISELEQQPCPMWPTTAKRLADALGVEITDIAVSDDDQVEVAS